MKRGRKDGGKKEGICQRKRGGREEKKFVTSSILFWLAGWLAGGYVYKHVELPRLDFQTTRVAKERQK